MSFLDKFLDAIKLNDDFDDEDDFLDDYDTETENEDKPVKSFFRRFSSDDDDDDDLSPEPPKAERKSADPVPAKASRKESSVRREKERPSKKSKITPVRRRSNGMEVNVIRPSTMEDSRDIADTLLDGCTVVLNLEGVNIDIAQRIIDFTCGTCYSLEGALQKISNYIYIVTPVNVDISGDFQSILDGNFDIPTIHSSY